MGVATADEVIMRNGDRISGDVVRQDNGQLQLDTDYAGTISIDWEKVHAVHLDGPVPVLLDDDKVIRVARVVREQDLMADQLQFYFTGMGFGGVSRENNDLSVSRTGLRLPLIGGFIGSVEYEIDYNSKPAEDAKTTDKTLRFKLGYQW